VKAEVGEYRQSKYTTVSNPQPVKTLQQWADVVATKGGKYQSCCGILNRLNLVNQLLWQTKKHSAAVIKTTALEQLWHWPSNGPSDTSDAMKNSEAASGSLHA